MKEKISLLNIDRLKKSLKKSTTGILNSVPIFLGIIIITGVLKNVLTADIIKKIITGGELAGAIIASLVGGIFAGNPVNSYILSGELLKNGISLFVVTAFIVSWVTVGVVQLPAESLLLGKNFAYIRNFTSLMLSIAVAAITVLLMRFV